MTSDRTCDRCGERLEPTAAEAICPACAVQLGRADWLVEDSLQTVGSGTLWEESTLTECPGKVIGRYELERKLGEGGFGTVWAAEQKEPVRRQVALKVIKLGMDTEQVVARFELERQALALMDHPNIAKVLDAGATDTGRPYFVMELVSGVPITDYCDREKLSTNDRLDLFTRVCQAIQHAHQKGIIHRDIKPSNILVSLDDPSAAGVPKVIDFGIAKATQSKLTEKTFYTQYHQFLGTPAYISPEQVGLSGLDIDTRTDIYSLGVLLYELLVGTTPFEVKKLMSQGIDALREAILEKEPPRPSTRLSTLDAGELTTVAARRSVEPGRLAHQIKGDLDCIVLKCLEKDRTRRYETANGLAMDIKRHLAQEPVIACPPSLNYRFGKFARRHKKTLASVAGVAIALLMGTVASLWQARLAKDERQRTEAVLAQSYADNGVRQLREGDRYGLLDLMNAVTTAENNPELQESLALLWSGWNQRWERRTLVRLGYFNATNDYAFKEQSHDGSMIAASADPHTVLLWRTDTGQLAGPPLAHGTNVLQGWRARTGGQMRVFRGSGLVMATVTVDGTIYLWDPTTCRPLCQPIVVGEQLNAYALSDDGQLLACAAGSTVDVRRIASGKTLWEAQHEGGATNLVFSPDGRVLASGGASKLLLWDVTLGKVMCPPLDIPEGLPTIEFSQDGKFLAAADAWTSGVSLWDIAAMPPGRRTLKTEAGVNSIAFSPDGALLAAGGRFGHVRVFATASGHEHLPSWRLTGRVISVSFSSDGRFLATGTTDGSAQVWATGTGEPAFRPIDFPSAVRARFITGDRLALSCEHHFEIMQMDAPVLSGRSLPHLDVATALAYNPAGNLLAIGTGKHVELWAPVTGRKTTNTLNLPAQTLALSFRSDGESVAVLTADGSLRVWNPNTDEVVAPALQNGRPTYAVALSQTGRFLAGGCDGNAGLWKVDSGETIHWPVLAGRTVEGRLSSMAFSSDERLLAVGDQAWNTAVFDTLTGKPAGGMTLHNERVACVVFHPNGRQIAVSTAASTTELIDLTTSRPVGGKLDNGTVVRSMAFNPEGTLLATAEGLKVELWHIGKRPVHSGLTLSHPSDIHALAFSPDGRHLAVGIHGVTRIWDLPQVPTDSKAVQLKTWITLSCRQDTNGSPEAVSWDEWNSLRQELREVGQSPKPNGTQLAEEVDWGRYVRLQASLTKVERCGFEQDWARAYQAMLEFLREEGFDWDAALTWDATIVQKVGGLCLVKGDHQTYLDVCQSQMGRYTKDSPAELFERAAKTCLLTPDPLPDDLKSQVVQWVEWVVKHRDRASSSAQRWMDLVIGMAQYRSGSYAEARITLKQAEDTQQLVCRSTALSYRALACHRLGQALESADLLRQSEETLARAGGARKAWQDVLNAELALKEAVSVIRGDGIDR